MTAGIGDLAAFPARDMAGIHDALTAPGQPFEMETITIRGQPTRTWKHAPANLVALAQAARQHGLREFLVLEDERVTFEGAYRATATLAARMADAGIVRGDRVALAMRNLPEWPVAFLAIVSLGAICVPLNAWWSADEMAYALRDCGATMLIADGRRFDLLGDPGAFPALRTVLVTRGDGVPLHGAEPLEETLGPPAGWSALPDRSLPDAGVAPDDDAAIFYTSGTTGRPKGAVGTHRNLVTNILSSAYTAARQAMRRGANLPLPATPPRVVLLAIPFFHVTACSATLMAALANGNTLVLMRRWDAGEALALIARERVEQTGGVPTIAWQLVEHPDRDRHDLSSLGTVSYGGAPAAPELVRRIAADLRAQPGNGWGMTETMATVTQHSAEDYLARPTSCGAPVAVADLRIMDRAGVAAMPQGEVGELWARGPMVVRGYWNRPAETAATFVDGWVRTGDLARIDADGFLHVVDRLRDMVIRGGENIYSSEVENALHAHPAVIDAAMIGLPHHTLGEVPAAVVRLRSAGIVDEAGLQDWVRQRLAAFKVPVAVRVVDTPLPRNAQGKVLKDRLRTLFADHLPEPGEAGEPPCNPLPVGVLRPNGLAC